MASKETFTQHLAHEMAQAVVHRERYGWPPDSQWGMRRDNSEIVPQAVSSSPSTWTGTGSRPPGQLASA